MGSDWGLGRRASWAMHGLVHGMVHGVVLMFGGGGKMHVCSTWIGEVGLGGWWRSGC